MVVGWHGFANGCSGPMRGPLQPGHQEQQKEENSVMKKDYRRLRVGMLLGCVQRVFFDRVNQATMRVLTAEGCEIVTPKEQPCCGALMLHCGEEASAMDFARRMIDAFDLEEVDVIAINSAGMFVVPNHVALRADPCGIDPNITLRVGDLGPLSSWLPVSVN